MRHPMHPQSLGSYFLSLKSSYFGHGQASHSLWVIAVDKNSAEWSVPHLGIQSAFPWRWNSPDLIPRYKHSCINFGLIIKYYFANSTKTHSELQYFIRSWPYDLSGTISKISIIIWMNFLINDSIVQRYISPSTSKCSSSVRWTLLILMSLDHRI